MIRRRTVLRGALAGIAGVALGPYAQSSRAADGPSITQITPELRLIEGLGGNVVALATGEGHVLVDGGASQHAHALLEAVGGVSEIHSLFNTHWHLEQVGANEPIGRSGAPIVAHAKTRQRLANEYYLPDEDRYQPALPREAVPSEVFYDDGGTVVGGRTIEYGYLLEAHTDGDIYVYFRDSNVIAVGDAIAPARDPVLDWFGGGWIGGRVDALATLLERTDAQTRFVPSYGPVVGRTEVQREHDVMLELFNRLVELIRQGMGPEDVLAADALDGLGRELEDPPAFVYAALKSLWAHHNTLSHDIV